LTNPPVDQDRLDKIRAKEKLRLAETSGKGNQKISLADKNAQKALIKAKSDLSIKTRRAEKNQKLVFGELKKILDKHDEEIIFKGS
jgi:hypothetical protein